MTSPEKNRHDDRLAQDAQEEEPNLHIVLDERLRKHGIIIEAPVIEEEDWFRCSDDKP